jgi:L-ascorbate metabolism protein UlaG (beta-lactamase superfamily)
MEIQFFGANCVRLSTKKAHITVDDNLAELGKKAVTKKDDIALFTAAHGEPASEVKLLIDQPGEYEVSDISVQGIMARSHLDEAKQHSATIFKVVAEDIRIVITGHIYPDLSDKQLEQLGRVDVLVIPVGGNGYTLDGIGALKMIREIEPKIIIPTHYQDNDLAFPVPQTPLEDAVKALAMEPFETVGKLKLKPADLSDATKLIILEKN